MIELVFRWLKRPHDAQDFERETRGLLPALYRTAYRLTGQRADAEDLVQDTYLKAFEAYRRTSFTSPDNLRVWMLKILTNTYLDRYRRQIRSPEVKRTGWSADGEDNVLEIIASPLPGPDVEIENKMFALAVDDALHELPGDVRIAVTLFFVEGLSYEQIGTVTSRLWRGRRALRQKLAAHGSRYQEAAPNARAGDGRGGRT